MRGSCYGSREAHAPNAMNRPLENKKILVCVSGGIAAFKAVELVRELGRRGAKVRVAMTPSATRFVGPITFTGLTGQKTVTDLWDPAYPGEIHVELADWAELIVVAPASTNLIARFASGLADDVVLATLACADGTIVLAPAMHDRMWRRPSTQRNLARLRGDGVAIVGPTEGALANGRVGMGRMVEAQQIADEVVRTAAAASDLRDQTVLISAGPTLEDLDPVRFISNRSSGRMGYALASVAAARGAHVILVTGPTHIPLPPRLEVVQVRSALDMKAAIDQALPRCDVVIMTPQWPTIARCARSRARSRSRARPQRRAGQEPGHPRRARQPSARQDAGAGRLRNGDRRRRRVRTQEARRQASRSRSRERGRRRLRTGRHSGDPDPARRGPPAAADEQARALEPHPRPGAPAAWSGARAHTKSTGPAPARTTTGSPSERSITVEGVRPTSSESRTSARSGKRASISAGSIRYSPSQDALVETSGRPSARVSASVTGGSGHAPDRLALHPERLRDLLRRRQDEVYGPAGAGASRDTRHRRRLHSVRYQPDPDIRTTAAGRAACSSSGRGPRRPCGSNVTAEPVDRVVG